ncbi:hypothetical protein XELAEV_18002403mg [Xenopus laevis]|nr:hypothetical protein XELAEV_18002403mg [Xenopus laevis]
MSSERFAGGSHANQEPSGRKRRSSEEFGGRKKSRKREETSKKRARSTSSDDSSITEEGSSQKRPCCAATKPLALTISSYTLHCMLGTGAFGKVALASTATTKQLVAIKSILKKPQKENMEIIVREARVLRVAAGHPYLCHAYAAFQTQTHAFFTMEYASGGSLMMEIRKRKHLKMRKLIFYSAEMICGLQYLHTCGIIHRDIKPDNIMLSSEGQIKIVDFGLAAEKVFGNDTISGRIGSLAYMAPEVIRDQEYNAAADWWSFGITLYEMATGQLPFHKGNSLDEVKRSILRDQPSYPVWLSNKLSRLLHKQSAEDFKDCRITTLQFLQERVPLGNYIVQDFSYQSPGWQA